MALAGKAYFDAVAKIGENAAVSPVSRELGKCLGQRLQASDAEEEADPDVLMLMIHCCWFRMLLFRIFWTDCPGGLLAVTKQLHSFGSENGRSI